MSRPTKLNPDGKTAATYDEALVLRSQATAERRTLVIEAASNGVKQAAGLFGAVSVVPTDKGFCVVFDNDDRLYFDTLEI